MFDFKGSICEDRVQSVTFNELKIGETFITYSAYEEFGLDEHSVWIYLKTSVRQAIRLNATANPAIVNEFGENAKVLIVQLQVSKISL